MRFEWDENKYDSNIEKHGVSFDEAVTVFQDVNALEFNDIDHSDLENRYIIIGFSSRRNLLMVVYTEKNGDIIRVISARKATKREYAKYLARQG